MPWMRDLREASCAFWFSEDEIEHVVADNERNDE